LEKFIKNYVPDWVYGKSIKPKSHNIDNNAEADNSNSTENIVPVDKEIVKDDAEIDNIPTDETTYPGIYTNFKKNIKNQKFKSLLLKVAQIHE
jgi:hypothetical protein